jgi:serine/threonine-protein kinase
MAWRLHGVTELGTIGAGGTGRVVSARHRATDTVVAVKYLSTRLRTTSDSVAQVRADVRTVMGLDDQRIVRLYEYVEVPGGAAIVMELVDGVSLGELIAASGPLEPESAAYVVRESARALAIAYARGVLHRDLKPGNILIDDAGAVRVMDFGVSVRVAGAVSAGSPFHMAPELWSARPATAQSDVYALAATLVEALTGQPPYISDTGLLGLRRAHEGGAPPSHGIPIPLRDAISRGLAKDPAMRPADAEAFAALLDGDAGNAYGVDWPEVGRFRLAQRTAPLVRAFGDEVGSPQVTKTAAAFVGGALTTRILLGAGAALLVIAGADTLLTSAAQTAVVASDIPSFTINLPSSAPTSTPVPTGRAPPSRSSAGAWLIVPASSAGLVGAR